MFETDDDDFTLTPSSKLASIFNATSIPDTNNASLHYKAPKQPAKPLDSNSKSVEKDLNCEGQIRVQSSVKLAKVITLWKFDNGKDKAMGKHMVAIIGSSSNDVFDMIIYQEKTKIIIREALGRLLNIYNYPNNFVAIYDSKGNLWNLNFDNSEDKDSFLQHANQYNCVIIDHTNESNHRDTPNESANSPDGSVATKIEKNNIVSEVNSDQFSSKEKILSRITKMGQQILPRTVGRNRSSELSESETESSYSDHRPSKPVTTPRKFKRNLNNQEKSLAHISTESNKNSNNILTPRMPLNNTSFHPNNHLLLNHQNSGIVYSQQLPDYGLSNFIIAQNAELKANLAEISMKLNNVLSSTDNNGNNEDIGFLHSKIKCQNLKIDNLSTDLERSRKALSELTNKYHEKCEALNAVLNEKELLGQNKVEVDILREKVQNMTCLQTELEDLKRRLKEKDTEIDSKNSKLKDFEEHFKISESANENLSKQVTDLSFKLEEAAIQVNELQEEIKQKDKDHSLTQNESLALDKDKVSKLVKESMNEAFRNIMENFDENHAYRFNNIQGVLLDNLKKTSYRLMNSLL